MDTFNLLDILRTKSITTKHAPLKMGVLFLYVSMLCSSSPIPNNSTSLGGSDSSSTSGPSISDPQGMNPSVQGFSTVETNINGKKSKSTKPLSLGTPINSQMNGEFTSQPSTGPETNLFGLPSSSSGSGSGSGVKSNLMNGSTSNSFGSLGGLIEALLGSSSISFSGNGKPSIQSWSTVETNINGKKNVTKNHYDSNNPGGNKNGSNSLGNSDLEQDGSIPTNYSQTSKPSSNSLSGSPYIPSNSLSETPYTPSNSLSETPYTPSNSLSGTPNTPFNSLVGSPASLSNDPSGYGPSGDSPDVIPSGTLGSGLGSSSGAGGYAGNMNSGGGGLGGINSGYQD